MTTHNAPPVGYPLGRSRLQAWVLAGLWFTGLLLVLAWFSVTGQLDWRIFVALITVVVAGAAACAGWKNSPVGQLAWDGQLWRWESPGYQTGVAEQKLVVIVDFQHLLLLRIENQAHASLWLWAERKALPERWLDFRRAVYSPHKAAGQPRHQDLRSAEAMQAVAVSDDVQAADGKRINP